MIISKVFLAPFILALSVLVSFFLTSCRVPPTPTPTANGSCVPISYAVFGWKNAEDFMRISEYFSDRENTGSNCICRTDNKERSGLYLILGLDVGEKIPAGSKAMLRYFRPDKIGEQTAEFILPDFTSSISGEILLGLTGDAWPKTKKKARPSAWQLSVTAPDGTLLVYRQSYLWAQ